MYITAPYIIFFKTEQYTTVHEVSYEMYDLIYALYIVKDIGQIML